MFSGAGRSFEKNVKKTIINIVVITRNRFVLIPRFDEANTLGINKKISLIGTSLKKASNYTKANWKTPFVLAMGNEQNGLSDKFIDNCDQLIKIPMLGKSDSLNLAVSTGIVLYESIRKNPN